jgi:hypothetical protein
MGVLVEINATVTCLVVVKDPILTYIAGIRETCIVSLLASRPDEEPHTFPAAGRKPVVVALTTAGGEGIHDEVPTTTSWCTVRTLRIMLRTKVMADFMSKREDSDLWSNPPAVVEGCHYPSVELILTYPSSGVLLCHIRQT